MTTLIKAIALVFIFAGPALAFAQEAELLPDKAEVVCAKDSDCVLVSNSCAQCCGRVAVAKSSQAKFEQRISECRKRWKGPICDCIVKEAAAKCVAKKCVAEEPKAAWGG